MSDTDTTTTTDAAVDPQTQPGYCPTCEVTGDDPCRTPSGRRAKTEHPTRKALRLVDGDTTTTDEPASPADAAGDPAPSEPEAPKGYTDDQVAEARATAQERLDSHKPIPNSKVRVLLWALDQREG